MAMNSAPTRLNAKLYADAAGHDELLAECFPMVLETLPEQVGPWSFDRVAGSRPHLWFRFRGPVPVLRGSFQAGLRNWGHDLVDHGLASRLTLGMDGPGGYADPELAAVAEETSSADSEVVLVQLRLAGAGALTMEPELLAALGMVDLAGAFCAEPGLDRLMTWWRARRPGMRRQLDLLLPSWDVRAAATRGYGEQLRRLAERLRQPSLVSAALGNLLHRHHVRLVGDDPARVARSIGLLADPVEWLGLPENFFPKIIRSGDPLGLPEPHGRRRRKA